MAAEPNAFEQAVSRALRDNLGRIHRASEELLQVIDDLISACASSRPTNVLPPLVRAQTSAAALSASLDVLSRFVTAALQPSLRLPIGQENLRVDSPVATEQPAVVERPTVVEQPEPVPAHLTEESLRTEPAPVEVSQPDLSSVEAVPAAEAPSVEETPPVDELPPVAEPVSSSESVPVLVHEVTPEVVPVVVDEARVESLPPQADPVFSLDSLPPEEQELHRRANRVAKVSMQDIEMLRPEDVRLGRENKDLCFRLRDDIEKAHREYDRRFQSIHFHSVDYFYEWMVEILAGGNPEALGEYPYPSPVLRH
jgi:hypothetical protein